MTLDNNTRSLEVKLSRSVTSNELTLVCSYSDINVYGKQTNRLVTNGVTAVKFLPAPLVAGATSRELKTASIQNTDTVATTVIVQLNDNATIAIIYKVTLQPNETLFYQLGRGWYVMDANGCLKESIPSTDINFLVNEIPSGLINSSNTIFNLSNVPIINSETVYYNGQLQRPGIDYTILSNTITFISAPETGTNVYVSYRAAIATNFSINEVPTGLINGSNAVFTLGNTPALNSETVYYNGQLQRPTTDYIISANIITFVNAPEIGTSVYVSYRY